MEQYTKNPWDLLPVPLPINDDNYDETFFYDNVVQHLIPDILRIMDNGIPLDLDKVNKLEEHVSKITYEDNIKLHDNPLIKYCLEQRHSKLLNKKTAKVISKHKTIEDFCSTFELTKPVHRTYLVNSILLEHNHEEFILDKWNITDIKQVLSLVDKKCKKQLKYILDKESLKISHVLKDKAMLALAEDKMIIHNKNKDKQISNYNPDLVFNTNSSTQMNELFDLFDVDTQNQTKKGAKKIDRKELERQLTEVSYILGSEDITEEGITFLSQFKEVLEICINNSNALNIMSTFIPAFNKHTVNGFLYGSLHLFGAKSFRLTSSDPNLLNLPSSGNVYAKTVKECFVVPEGWIIYAVDFNALEDRVIANLSGDYNKQIVFLQDLDSHCLNAIYYVPEKLENILPRVPEESNETYVVRFKEAVDEGNKELKAIRNGHKSCTFGLSYGCGVKKLATMLGCSLEAAQVIYDNYHYKLYKDITRFREEEVIPKAMEDGRIHLGLGCYMYSDNPEEESRTLFNACSQFWSILSLLTINKFHSLVDENNLQDDVKVIASIYDSIYIMVREDVSLIKWVNDTIIPIMTKDFLIDQTVPNRAEGDLGYNWATLKTISNNASIEEIIETIQELNNVN